jgi:hypothetical protein
MALGFRWRRLSALQRLLFLVWGVGLHEHRTPRVLIDR